MYKRENKDERRDKIRYKRKEDRKENRKEIENIESNFVRVKLYNRTPGDKSNDRSAPAPHSQQNKIGVPPILELNKASFGSRRTTTPVYRSSR